MSSRPIWLPVQPDRPLARYPGPAKPSPLRECAKISLVSPCEEQTLSSAATIANPSCRNLIIVGRAEIAFSTSNVMGPRPSTRCVICGCLLAIACKSASTSPAPSSSVAAAAGASQMPASRLQPSSTATTPDKPSVANYFGTWRIKRFAKLGFGSAGLTDRYAEGQIGKAVALSGTSAYFDKDFLWRGGKRCEHPTYKWAAYDEFIGHGHQALLPADHPDRRDDLLFLDVDCEGRGLFGCEITVKGECVAYYDGYSFFLAKDESASPK